MPDIVFLDLLAWFAIVIGVGFCGIALYLSPRNMGAGVSRMAAGALILSGGVALLGVADRFAEMPNTADEILLKAGLK